MGSVQKNQGLQSINSILADIGRNNGSSLSLDENRICLLDIAHEKEAVLQVNAGGTSVKLVAYVGSSPYQGNTDLLEKLMIRNFEYSELSGCRVGLCSQSRRVVLAVDMPISSLSSISLTNLLGHFLEVVKQTEETVAELEREVPAEGGSNDPDSSVHVFDVNFIKP